MEELLTFVKNKISAGVFIGLNTSEVDGITTYAVDYWEDEVSTSNTGEEIEIKAGKQKTFIL